MVLSLPLTSASSQPCPHPDRALNSGFYHPSAGRLESSAQLPASAVSSRTSCQWSAEANTPSPVLQFAVFYLVVALSLCLESL